MPSQCFAQIPADEWRLAESVTNERRTELCAGVDFGEIVDRIVKDATLLRHRRQRCPIAPQFFRALVTLKVDPSTVDLFHNSDGGYRAQYYRSAKDGDCANAYALKVLIPRIEQLLKGHEKRTCHWAWVAKSLLDPAAKVWIYQGQWLRQAKRSDQQLLVERWAAQASSQDRV